MSIDVYTRDIVKRYGFKFSKSLGQNFLIDNSVLEDILGSADVSSDDVVLEIGPGVGTLTRELLKKAKKVYAVEVDSTLIPILKEELKEFDNFELINKDILKLDIKEILKEENNVKVVANLPYYVTTPIVLQLLNEDLNFKSLTVMVQKEVGERMAADPGCKEYGSLSVLVQYYCDIEIIRKVSSSCFVPSPKVDSVVIKLSKCKNPRVTIKDKDLFFKIVRFSFNMRRKTLWNALKPLNIDKEELRKIFEICDIDPKRRGETLSLDEFGRLSDFIYDFI
ncbi:16S rRNA (adenine(1518)-N(6)/adenine(1519)-N(6))-dimethyltransferase RsmA [Clostridium fermenticellae]|uniref:Ribosomal RNA small subunit methyltransferase A n=1 Tax=Clostridium fermenticellae TaxID=2068654 RepID=A0A386H0H5_9CLOT|nr:16S rRNA (adenine(1518)-N(6)/adenine(1519)-N(6))-dimethyltransferase RsmA [Clostridium fermenticellae]AYD39135.1 16S rRNA (adenine(1518)-N(6)/adenine(1519)-N(6))-dimethyltransferase RsmA [Clostridium fermenticellae]